MVKNKKKNPRKKRSCKGFKAYGAKARKIIASTSYETCTEQLSPFGGLLAVIKFWKTGDVRDILTFAFSCMRSTLIQSLIKAENKNFNISGTSPNSTKGDNV